MKGRWICAWVPIRASPIALACPLLAPSLPLDASRRTWLSPDLLLIVWLVGVRMRLLWLWVNLQVHGDTFGKTTRNCLSAHSPAPPALSAVRSSSTAKFNNQPFLFM